MDLTTIKNKYKNVPTELKSLKRWVCFKVEGMEDGRKTKRPYNALTGKFAKVNDDITWTTFDLALSGCVKFNCDGIGFVLGNGIFGIDLDNHPDENGLFPLSQDKFDILCKEFIEQLNSYTEISQSGNGIHIICAGKLPEGARRKDCVEMYDKGRFFAFTGNAINNIPIMDREEEVKPLWQKYVYTEKPIQNQKQVYCADKNRIELKLSDEEVISAIMQSSQSDTFYRYYHDGDISLNGSDHSKADMSFCNMLAWWCNKDTEQMDRIFRNSALMRDKWDEFRGDATYGEITLQNAIQEVAGGYVKTVSKGSIYTVKDKTSQEYTVDEDGVLHSVEEDSLMNLDENGEPIFRIKNIIKSYSYTDTGNADRFYDYFGDLFKYNVTDKVFMFWTGKTWIRDTTNIIRKYANKFLDILKEEQKKLEDQIAENTKAGRADKVKQLEGILQACEKNRTRVSNKAGKDAMLSEFQSLYDIPIESSRFNEDDFLLNTDSGIVDLRTGKISDFDKTKLMSKNTNVKVSYENPTVWLGFLQSVFNNGNIVETQEIIDCLQKCLGYTLTGSTKEQVMFLLYGLGSNGKSTLTETIAHVLGTYGDNIASSVLMQPKNANNSAIYSIAKLQTARFVETGETDDGGKLAEAQLKILTGGDTISAQFKFGNEFSFKPRFKIWMSTNNKPIIRGTDHGIWRRLFLFPFKNSFTGPQKDKTLPDRLRAESDKILGWCIQGYLKYLEKNDFCEPQILKKEKEVYQVEMDVVAQFVSKECIVGPSAQVDCKALYSHYKEWALDNTEFTLKESKFSEGLKTKGITTSLGKTGKQVYVGIKLKGFNMSSGV